MDRGSGNEDIFAKEPDIAKPTPGNREAKAGGTLERMVMVMMIARKIGYIGIERCSQWFSRQHFGNAKSYKKLH